MMSIQDQIESGMLVCPKTQTRLGVDGSLLVSSAGTSYRITDSGVPILLTDAVKAEQYIRGSSGMMSEYKGTRGTARLVRWMKAVTNKDYRTRASRNAFDKAINLSPEGSLCLSIGGGPTRANPRLTNLNIGPFPNVDVVADAHLLPYASATVGAVYCEAVLEHLTDPALAVQEMFRVLKPGGKVIAITPFMQRFHGYPYHFQNFTLLGHALIFERAGFRVLESGTCVGPTYAIVGLIGGFLTQCLPKLIGLPLGILWKALGVFLSPLDLFLGRTKTAHIMASTTYVLAEKP
jgi:SAM-dependent methyltransferase